MTGREPKKPPSKPPRIPPRWFIITAWHVHRFLVRATNARLGLSRPRPGRYGLLRLHTRGRRTGSPRAVILAYYEDGADLVVLAMNGWAEPHPAWWLNLQASPRASVDLPGRERRSVTAREAHGEERTRLWRGYDDYEPGVTLDDLSGLRSRETPVVVLEG